MAAAIPSAVSITARATGNVFALLTICPTTVPLPGVATLTTSPATTAAVSTVAPLMVTATWRVPSYTRLAAFTPLTLSGLGAMVPVVVVVVFCSA